MSHQVKDATIRVRALDGGWETISTDRAAGIAHENLETEHDQGGPVSASFDLRRHPRTPWPDIAAFTDVEIEIGGVQTWKGRVKGTPARDAADRSMSVQCEGLQSHLDDDTYVPFYVHTRLADWRDHRTLAAANLGGGWSAAPQVSSDRGGVSMSFASGVALAIGARCGITLDLGSAALAKRVVITWTSSNPGANYSIFLAAHDNPDQTASANREEFSATLTAASGTTSGTTTTARRYVTVFLYSAANQTPGSEVWLKIASALVVTDTAYESGNASALKASTVVTDALAKATVLLDADRTLIQATSFNLPELASLEDRTPREVITAVNALHNYAAKIDERGRPVFAPLPSAPAIEVGEWAAIEGEDASQNNGEDIYERAVVTGRDPSGAPVRVERYQAARTGAPRTLVTSPAASNPSFDTNTASWSVTGTGATITRTTTAGEFASSPAAGKWETAANNLPGVLTADLTGTFVAGRTYVITVAMRAGASIGLVFQIEFGSGSDYSIKSNFSADESPMSSTFNTYSIAWTPTRTVSGGFVRWRGKLWPGFEDLYKTTATIIMVDNVAMHVATGTLVERRGFRRTKRLPVNAALPSDGLAAQQIADTYLATHRTAQFKGEYTITGPVREILTGKPIPPEQLGMRTTELLRFTDRIDPDTGAVGRDGRIVRVRYRLADDSATVAVDNTSANYEAMLARYGALQGDAT